MNSTGANWRLLSTTHIAKPLCFVFSFFFSTKQNPKDFADFTNTPKPMDSALIALFAIALVVVRFYPPTLVNSVFKYFSNLFTPFLILNIGTNKKTKKTGINIIKTP